jgi:hypothetical protein
MSLVPGLAADPSREAFRYSTVGVGHVPAASPSRRVRSPSSGFSSKLVLRYWWIWLGTGGTPSYSRKYLNDPQLDGLFMLGPHCSSRMNTGLVLALGAALQQLLRSHGGHWLRHEEAELSPRRRSPGVDSPALLWEEHAVVLGESLIEASGRPRSERRLRAARDTRPCDRAASAASARR